MTTAEQVFSKHTRRPIGPPTEGEAYAPSNIALSKYWGKRDAALNLPLNSSLSISLGPWGTHTRIEPAENDRLTFNGVELTAAVPEATKVWRFVDLFAGPDRAKLHITTENSIPTAAGLASSASGFAALTLALDGAFQTALSRQELSMLARFGSGSATRSFWHGFVRWQKGQDADGRDSHGQEVESPLDDLRIAIIAVDTGPKSQTSRDGMNHTVATSLLFESWPAQAEADCAAMEQAVKEGAFDVLGPLAEANALAMHATMMAARPSLVYLKPQSWQVLETLWHARKNGLCAYATMDAGANVKLIFRNAIARDVRDVFPNAQVINPWQPHKVEDQST
ncbi:MAG: diphosphomevalonate decarboxylase [Pseudomonadota bacterium]